MPGLPENTHRPSVSIILPTYNRESFLPDALASIRAQTFTDWELIVVDDGSTDDTREMVPTQTAGWPQRVRYLYQENQGAYGARNTGLDHARGRYIAFFDSDDQWLPHHLKNCAEALDANPDVDWVYGACRIVDHATGEVVEPSTFYVNGRPRPFMMLKARAAGRLKIIDDDGALRCMFLQGTYSGLQNSLLRREFFDGYRFEAATRNEAEDQLAVVRALAERYRLGYLDDVHVVYRIHGANSSASAVNGELDQRVRVIRGEAEGYERLAGKLPLGRIDQRALRRRLQHDFFWKLGYSLFWQHGRRDEALRSFRRGLAWWPWDWRCWKTYALARTRTAVPEALKRPWWFLTDADYRRKVVANRRRISAFRSSQRRAVGQIVKQKGDRILAGPFRGLCYTPCHRNSYCAHVLLGTYEKELHAIVDNVCRRGYSTIVDVGAAEGYYACGLAMRQPQAHVVAFESEPAKRELALELAASNGIRNVELRGECGAESLRRILGRDGGAFVFCDIDGGEEELLDPRAIPEPQPV